MRYNRFLSEEENKGLYQVVADGCWYCVDSDVAPGQKANSDIAGVNYSSEHKSMWILADEHNVYVRTEWRDPIL